MDLVGRPGWFVIIECSHGWVRTGSGMNENGIGTQVVAGRIDYFYAFSEVENECVRRVD